MKNSKLLVSCAVAGMLLGSQAALADNHKKKDTADHGKGGCKGKDAKEEKHTCKGAEAKKADGKGGCNGKAGCEAKEEEKKEEE